MQFELVESVSSIGRDSSCAIHLNHSKISKNHAVITQENSSWVIEDLQSTNGLMVNGSKVRKARLQPGDEIFIGPYDFVFEVEEAVQGAH